MGNKKKRNRTSAQLPQPPSARSAPVFARPSSGGGGSSLGNVDAICSSEEEEDEISSAELATAVHVVNFLGRRPELFLTRPLKALRAALDPLVQLQLKKYDAVDYTVRVTTALRHGKGADALLALQGMHAYQQSVKQGTIQRWVRDCDAISNENGMRVKLLQAVLLAGKQGQDMESDVGGVRGVEGGGAGQSPSGGGGSQEVTSIAAQADADAGAGDAKCIGAQAETSVDAGAAGVAAGPVGDGVEIIYREQWDPRAVAGPDGLGSVRVGNGSSDGEAGDTDKDGVGAGAGAGAGDAGSSCAPLPLEIRVVMKEEGEARQPPNHYDLNIFACTPGALALATPGSSAYRQRPRRVEVPGVPGAFVILDLLSQAECGQIRAAAERMGFTPDHPRSRPAPSGIGACEWVVDDALLMPLYNRAKPHLPPQVGGGELVGVNARWRIFRYSDVEGAVYRPHIDGSWPGSGLDHNGVYRHDNFGDRRSRLTFLIYLNGDAEGGSTTFYMPRGTGSGLEAIAVRPVEGAVLCFPQGNSASLLHEGSAVHRGVKVVARTDVLYLLPRRG